LEAIGLVNSINAAVIQIDAGRKGFAIKGKADEGSFNYEKGISTVMTTFQQAQIFADPLALLFAEYAFITQEFELTPKSDKDTITA